MRRLIDGVETMTGNLKSAFGAALAHACVPAAAQAGEPAPSLWAGPEIAVGVLRHGANFHPLGDRLVFPALPAGQVYADSGEDGTVDVELLYRTAPVRFLLKPRLTAKLQISTAGRTSFGSLGLEWRQHLLHGRLYGQAGIGVTVHDGYLFTPDPTAPGLSDTEAARRHNIERRRISFGSRVLFNPNLSLGVRLDRQWAVEAVWEHFSHRRLFSEQNPGIDNLGIRLIRVLGSRR